MRYSVTGLSSPLSSPQGTARRVRGAFADLDPVPSEFTTGAAEGIDTLAAHIGLEVWGLQRTLHRVCIPAGVYYHPCWEDPPSFYVVERVTGGYMKRNDRLVDHADVLLAFPRNRNEYLRSGTWATVRRARKRGIEVRIYPLEGS